MKRAMNRVCALFLAGMMVLGCFPATALATPPAADSGVTDSAIDTVSITGVTPPQAGQLPDRSYTSVTPSEGLSYTVINWMVWDDQNPGYQYTSEPFEAGKQYVLEVVASADENHYFTDDVTVWVNGEEAEFWSQPSSSQIFAHMPFDRLPGGDKFPVAVTISEPKAGVMADNGFDISNLPGSFWLMGSTWMQEMKSNPGNFEQMVVGTLFEAGTRYRASVMLGIPSDISIDNVTLTFNGVESTDSLFLFSTEENGLNTNVYAFYSPQIYTAAEADPDDFRIDGVSITGITPPQVGQLPDIIDYTVTPSEGLSYTSINWMVWDDEDGGYYYMSNPFEAGKQYVLEISATAAENYFFADDATVWVNGAKADLVGEPIPGIITAHKFFDRLPDGTEHKPEPKPEPKPDGGGDYGSADNTSAPPPATTPNVNTDGTVDGSRAAAEATAALESAPVGGRAVVGIRGAESIAPDALRSLAASAAGTGKTLVLHADTMLGGSVQGRLYLEPAKLAEVTGSIRLGVFTDPARTAPVTDLFEHHFENTVRTVRFAQQGGFGARIEVAVKVDLGGLDTAGLHFYAYDAATNSYRLLANPAHWVDTNGYLHFHTEFGGSVVITDRPLTPKK